MHYYNEVKKDDKYIAAIFVGCYVVLLIVAILFVNFTVEDKFKEYPPREGILVAFGDMQEGRGTELLQKSKTEVAPTPKPVHEASKTSSRVDQNVPTPSNKVSDVKTNDNAEDAVLKTTSETVAKPREVKASALYSANNGSTATSIGAKNQKGTMGSNMGSQDSDNHTITDGFSLDGRAIIGALPRPQYNSNNEGRVVVDIQVNRDGVVTSATFKAVSSTTNDSRLVKEAIAAAKKARFNVDGEANFIQAGTITYIFKVK